ncbi:MAG: peroxiredoxin [Rhodobacteraceae bacterium]|nr:peroxiredoxin [Paracoccaceae bacterium]
MTLRLGDTAPNFTTETTKGEITLHDWSGDSWVFFFSHPADFTPVCTTEMGMTAKHAADFAARNVLPLGLSTDTVAEHEKWISDVNETQNADIQFPIVADSTHEVANLYDMLHPEASATATVRSVFIIDPNNKIRLTMTYPMNVGRNFDEILRVIDALQIADEKTVALPANWRPGDAVIVPLSVSTEDAKAKYADLQVLTPYLRVTKDY